MIRFACCSLLLLAACPPKNAPATTPPPQPPSAGCPAASDVYIASYLTQDPGVGRTGWVLPMHAMKVEQNQQVPEYQTLDAAAATASGVPAGPVGNMWLISGATPCQVRLAGAYAKVDGPPASLSYGFELDGCPAPADPEYDTGIVLVSQESPNGCTFESPKPIAQRLGTMDAKHQWVKPDKENEKPIPPALVPALPTHECVAPGCEALWAIAEIAVANQPIAWAGALNWLAVGDATKTCGWKSERFSGFFIPSPDGKPIRVTEGQSPEHPLALSAALVDHSGGHVLIADGPGEYATYDLTPGKATLGHHTEWQLGSPEQWEMFDNLGPLCDPDAPPAAPLPKDAKPVSPYP